MIPQLILAKTLTRILAISPRNAEEKKGQMKDIYHTSDRDRIVQLCFECRGANVLVVADVVCVYFSSCSNFDEAVVAIAISVRAF